MHLSDSGRGTGRAAGYSCIRQVVSEEEVEMMNGSGGWDDSGDLKIIKEE